MSDVSRTADLLARIQNRCETYASDFPQAIVSRATAEACEQNFPDQFVAVPVGRNGMRGFPVMRVEHTWGYFFRQLRLFITS